MTRTVRQVRSLIVIATGAIVCMSGLVIAAPAQAANCRPDPFNSTDFFGNQRYRCPDGNYTLKKPFGAQSWTDPFTTYELSPNYGGGWNSSKQRCRYDSFLQQYKCR